MIKINGYSISKHPYGYYVDCFSIGLVLPTLKKAMTFVLSSVLYDNGFMWIRGTDRFFKL